MPEVHILIDIYIKYFMPEVHILCVVDQLIQFIKSCASKYDRSFGRHLYSVILELHFAVKILAVVYKASICHEKCGYIGYCKLHQSFSGKSHVDTKPKPSFSVIAWKTLIV